LNPRWPTKRLAFKSPARSRDGVKLFNEIGRATGAQRRYTRILKMGFRVGDNAPMAFMELVDRPQPVAKEESTEAS